jgi:DNA helicase-2/ATP-dependent DNA helicase PcrA
MLGNSSQRAILTTYHSFAADLLRQHGSHIGVDPNFTILSQGADREAVLLDAIASVQGEHPELERADVRLLPLIDNLLTKLVPEDAVRSHIRDPELASKIDLLYRLYRKRLRAANELDFPTLLSFAYELLAERPAVAKQLRSTYRHILVDEFQDTNHAQFEFLRRLVGNDPSNLFIVADDDQIIYAWNGADPARLADLRRLWDMEVIQLPTNYRCPPLVIELANALIVHNLERSPEKQPLVAGLQGDFEDAVSVQAFGSARAEGEWVARDIAALSPAKRGDCVVLGRTRRLLQDAQAALHAEGVDAVLFVRKNDFTSAPFRWLMAMLRLAAGRGDRDQLRTVSKSFFQLEGIDLSVEDVIASASARGGDYFLSFLEEALARDALEPETRSLLIEARATLGERLDFVTFVDAALAWFETVEASPSVVDRALDDYKDDREIWNEIYRQARARLGDTISLVGLLQELDLTPKSPPIQPGAVRCFTIHNAKGMEFPRVYLMGLAEEIMPSYQAVRKGPDSREMQEERRNCFVGLTRTREQLTMTYAREYYGWPKQRSRFLAEMGIA